MNDQHNLLDSIKGAFVPVHQDGHKFVFGAAVITLFLFVVATPLGWIAAFFTAACAYFFRDPERVTPARPGLIVSAADGIVAGVVENVTPPRELALGTDPVTRVSVFLSVLNVHIVRAPVGGRVIHSVYVPGTFINAELDKASEENERQVFVIETEAGQKIGVVMIAGLIARRIVTFIDDGASLTAGERIGLIRFGSRVDLYLPDGVEVIGEAGQTAIGGETVLAAFPRRKPAGAARRKASPA